MGGIVTTAENQQLDCEIDEITAKSKKAIHDVERLEAAVMDCEQVDIKTIHTIHAGTYLRTITMPAGCLVTGAIIKLDTTLIVSGDVILYVDGEPVHVSGYHILPAHKGRKQAVLANTESNLTMVFPTQATTVDEAEREMTDEFEKLGNRKQPDCNIIQITGV